MRQQKHQRESGKKQKNRVSLKLTQPFTMSPARFELTTF